MREEEAAAYQPWPEFGTDITFDSFTNKSVDAVLSWPYCVRCFFGKPPISQ